MVLGLWWSDILCFGLHAAAAVYFGQELGGGVGLAQIPHVGHGDERRHDPMALAGWCALALEGGVSGHNGRPAFFDALHRAALG